MPPKQSKKLARTKGKGAKGKNSIKFNLGVKALLRALVAAENAAARSVKVGETRVRAARKVGNKPVLVANRFNLKGARDAQARIGNAVKSFEAMACIDQWMNCDPEYF